MKNRFLLIGLALLLVAAPALAVGSYPFKYACTFRKAVSCLSTLAVTGTTTLTGAVTHSGATTNTGAVTNSSTLTQTGVATFTAQPLFNADGVTSADGVKFAGATNDAIINVADQANQDNIYTVPDVDADANFVMLTAAQSVAGTLTRADLTQEDLATYPVNYGLLRTNAGVVLIGSETAGSFHLVDGGIGTGSLTVNGEESLSETETSTMAFSFALPPEYVAGQTVTLHVRADVTGGGTLGATKTIDAEVYELTNNGAVGTDLNATAAGTLVAATPTDFDFTITPTGLAAGDLLQVYIQTAVQESAGTAIRAVLSEIEIRADIKG